MKALRILSIVLLAVCTLSVSAAKKKSKKQKKETPVEKVDTVAMDIFSYAYGKANTQGLLPYLQQREGVESAYMADFLEGFLQTEETEADKRMKARLVGVKIRQQLETQLYPNASRQVCDSVDLMSKVKFVEGFTDGIKETGDMTMDSAQAIVAKQMTYYKKVEAERKYGANRAAGEDFLKQNAKKDSVQTTASGLQYKVLVAGTGEKPTATDKVKVDYEGRLIDGTVFDSSYSRGKPATFGVNQVIKGWTEALQMMPVGSKWEVYIPQELAYGEREQSKIKPFSCLIFTVELLDIVK
ncbi:MAG: FKBP-type peptidyl-prolyl cis-trans isomerase [Bacteroidaceae bacterium]|nr:FKBP-type peptidyl-prolyl cis-trans isomerase [Bacteroidaceae bacterium]